MNHMMNILIHLMGLDSLVYGFVCVCTETFFLPPSASFPWSWFDFVSLSCFQVSVLTTLERRFNLQSADVGVIASSFEIGNLALILFVSYFGAKAHRPRLIGCGGIVMALGALLSALPEFLTNQYEIGETWRTDLGRDACSNNTINEAEDSVCANKANTNMMYLLLIGAQVLLGIGATPVQPLGVSYIDDHVKKKDSSLYIGEPCSENCTKHNVTSLLSAFCLLCWGGKKVSEGHSCWETLAEWNYCSRKKRWLSRWKLIICVAAHWFPKATKTGAAQSQPWTCLFITFRCNVCTVWVNTVYMVCVLFCCTPSPFVPCMGRFTWAPGEQILELFNLHYSGFSGEEARCGLNASASLNPLSKARCCWCGSLRFKGAFKVLSVQSSEHTMAVQGYVFAVMCIFCYFGTQKVALLCPLSHAGFFYSSCCFLWIHGRNLTPVRYVTVLIHTTVY